MDEETKYWVAFSVFPGIGPVRFKLLLNYFGSAKKAWEASAEELDSVNLGPKLTEKFIHFRNTFDLASYMTDLSYHHVNTVIQSDIRYPRLLREISDSPIVLYIKSKSGMPKIDMERTIAVVGTRKATPYGRNVTAQPKLMISLEDG